MAVALAATMILAVPFTSMADIYNRPVEPIENGWKQTTSYTGSVVWNYYENYKELKDTTTPDGYKVNEFGNLYTFCPEAELVETPEPVFVGSMERLFYPFSFDGYVLKNDYLGVSCKYDESDYLSGYTLTIRNSDGMGYAGICIVTSDDTRIALQLVAHQTDQDIAERVEYLISVNQKNEGLGYELVTPTYVEIPIAGKTFKGCKFGLFYAESELYYPLSNGMDLKIITNNWKYKGDDFDYCFNDAINWLNTHLTIK